MFGLLVLVGLFVALTPGILFRLKGSKKVSAAMHAVLFGVVVYVVSMYGVSLEGFQNSPACGGTSTFANGMCMATTPARCLSGTLKPNTNVCFQNGKSVGPPICPPNMQGPRSGVCTAAIPAVCGGGLTLTSNGMCKAMPTNNLGARPGPAQGGMVPGGLVPLGGIFGSTVFTPGQMIYCNKQPVPLKVISMPTTSTVKLGIPGEPTIPASLCTNTPPK